MKNKRFPREYPGRRYLSTSYIMSPYWNILASVSPYLSEEECNGFVGALDDVIKAITD